MDEGSDCDSRLQFAANLADYFNAHITGIFIEPPLVSGSTIPPVAPPSGVPITQGDIEAHEKKISQTKRELQEKLAQFTNPDGTLLSLRSVLASNPKKALLDTGRCYDLIVIGRDLGGNDLFGLLLEPATDIALNVACPVLVVPSKVANGIPIKQPLIAWNGSREATRAVMDALPLLKTADSVTVFSGHNRNTTPKEAEASRKNILTYLSLHDVDADYIDWELNDNNVGELLLSRVENQGHDLVVMGAYGHSQLRELFFGSVSRDLLKDATVPVLLSN